ncbi:serine/threonine-protein kinase [Nocardia brevicatena]|uniref:serine/threonine-protein kinase n=1 Tax=Nocardia brevicatena TaxID=37327 RepID=UPI0002FD01D9|nr:serine/threonine-protein kinase [Nocardia brevicatena]
MTTDRLVAGRYRLTDPIGTGAMGVVWRALDTRLQRTVAVKQVLLGPHLSPAAAKEARMRALREGRIAARLHHPNAITVFDVADEDNQPWLVMEYMDAPSLAVRLAGERTLPPPEVARIGAQAAGALAAAHDAGIVHRDVKPANLLVADNGTVKITDFGISRAAGDVTVTATGLLAGTPAYLSPEVARGENPEPASDVFALGSTLYAAVTGRPPFGEGDNPLAVLHAVAGGKVAEPEGAGELGPVLMRLLEPDPTDRPTMREAQRLLTDVAAGRGSGPAHPATKVMPMPGGEDSTGGRGTSRKATDGESARPTKRLPETPAVPVAPAVAGADSGSQSGAPGSAPRSAGPGGGPGRSDVPAGSPGGVAGFADDGMVRPTERFAGPPVPEPRPGAAFGASPVAVGPVPPPAGGGPASPASGARASGGGRGRIAVLVVAGVLAVAVLAGVILTSRGGDPSDSAAGAAGATAVAPGAVSDESGSADEEPSSATGEPGSVSGTHSSATAETGPLTDARVEQFVREYYGLLPGDTGTAWARLSPQYQGVAGGYGDYTNFWSTISAVRITSVTPAGPGTVVAGLTYTLKNGSTTSESRLFHVTSEGGRLLVADSQLR